MEVFCLLNVDKKNINPKNGMKFDKNLNLVTSEVLC